MDAMHKFLASVRQEEAELDRVLATVLFTDVVDSTEGGRAGRRALERTLERQTPRRAMIARYRGAEVKTTGDGFLVTFDGTGERCEVRPGLRGVKPIGIEVRAGLPYRRDRAAGDDVGGIAVPSAARVAALAGPSEVLVSSTVQDLVAGSGLTFEDRGEHDSKACRAAGDCSPAGSSSLYALMLVGNDGAVTMGRGA